MFIDAVFTIPDTIVEQKYKYRISAINTVIVFYNIQKKYFIKQSNTNKKYRTTDALLSISAKKQKSPQIENIKIAFCQAIVSICIKSTDKKSTIYFLYIANTKLSAIERLRIYSTSRSFTRYFIDKYIKYFPKNIYIRYNICNKNLLYKSVLINHAEQIYKIVSHRLLSSLDPI